MYEIPGVDSLRNQDLIASVYKKISKKYNLKLNSKNPNERWLADDFITKYIASFMESSKENKCRICDKPNWNKLAIELGIRAKNDFYKRKCTFCKLNAFNSEKEYVPATHKFSKLPYKEGYWINRKTKKRYAKRKEVFI